MRKGFEEYHYQTQHKCSWQTLNKNLRNLYRIWADRVMRLSVCAFPELPEEYMYQQAVKRICHGCINKEVGQYIVNLNLDSVEQVIDKIKSFQLNHASIYDKPKKDEKYMFLRIMPIQVKMKLLLFRLENQNNRTHLTLRKSRKWNCS